MDLAQLLRELLTTDCDLSATGAHVLLALLVVSAACAGHLAGILSDD